MNKKIIATCIGCGLVFFTYSELHPYCEKCAEERKNNPHSHYENYEIYNPGFDSADASNTTTLSASPSPSPSFAPDED
jgi:hypothetical protein